MQSFQAYPWLPPPNALYSRTFNGPSLPATPNFRPRANHNSFQPPILPPPQLSLPIFPPFVLGPSGEAQEGLFARSKFGPALRFSPTVSDSSRAPDPRPSPQQITNNEYNVYVRLLPPRTVDADLVALGSLFGRVLSVRVLTEESNNQRTCRGIGFILFSQIVEAHAAVIGLNNRGFDASIAQDSVRSRLAKLADIGSSNLYLANLPKEYNELQVMHLFTPSIPKSIRILREEDGTSRGIAFARLEDRASAEAANARLRDVILPGNSCPLRIRFADSVDQRAFKKQQHGKSAFSQQHQRQRSTSSSSSVWSSSPSLSPPFPTSTSQSTWPSESSFYTPLSSSTGETSTDYSDSPPPSHYYKSTSSSESSHIPGNSFSFPSRPLPLPLSSYSHPQQSHTTTSSPTTFVPIAGVQGCRSADATPTKQRFYSGLPQMESTGEVDEDELTEEEGEEEEEEEEEEDDFKVWLGPVKAWNMRWASQRKSLP